MIRCYGCNISEEESVQIRPCKPGLGQGVMGIRKNNSSAHIAYNFDNLVKSPKTVMPDLIRHPEVIEFTGFRLSPE